MISVILLSVLFRSLMYITHLMRMRAVYQCIYALVITIIMNEMKDISDKIKLFDWKYINKNPFPFRYYIMMMIIYTSFTYHILYSLCPAANMKLYIEYFDIFCAWWITSPPRLENNTFRKKILFRSYLLSLTNEYN